MSKLYSAVGLAERALRKIGAYSLAHSAADPDEMEETLHWLDLILGELSGNVRRFMFYTDEVSLTIAADTQSYDLVDVLDDDWPDEGVMSIQEAWAEDSAGNRRPITIVRRDTFGDLDPQDKAGDPLYINLTRVPRPSLRVWPVPATAGWTLKLILQKLGPNIAPETVTANPTPPVNSQVAHNLLATYQVWCVIELSAQVGDGPVRKLDSGTITRWKGEAAAKKMDLDAFDGMEHDTETPRVASWDVGD